MARSVDELTHAWLASLAHERRMSGHTLRAYGDDVRRFLGFLVFHRSGPVTLAALRALRPADIRAFLTQRRAEGLGPRGVQRALAGLRSFYRYLERENLADGAALRSVRSPKLPRTLPRPLSEVDAVRAIADSGQEDEPWIAVRNAALLTLLYGTGLRISEALSLKRGDTPLGETLTIIGKGSKERAVPVLAAVREALEQYARACPFDAIHIDPKTGLPVVIEKSCVSCGKCVKACPRKIIQIRPQGASSKRVFVSCINTEKGGVARKNCSAACIACGKCVKECAVDAIVVDKNLAYIDFNKCVACRKCVGVCPTGAILATFDENIVAA